MACSVAYNKKYYDKNRSRILSRSYAWSRMAMVVEYIKKFLEVHHGVPAH
jgi:hypothetical protein